MRIKNYFKVYKNGILIGQTDSASKKDAIKFKNNGGNVFIGTHMGEWRRAPTGYRYHTTTGVTLDFVKFGRES